MVIVGLEDYVMIFGCCISRMYWIYESFSGFSLILFKFSKIGFFFNMISYTSFKLFWLTF